MAEYKFGQLVQEEEKEQEIPQPEIQEKKPYQFGQPIEPRTNDPLVEETKSRWSKTTDYIKQGGINLFEEITRAPSGYLNSVRAQAYDDLLQDFNSEMDADADTSALLNKVSRNKGVVYDYIRSGIEQDIGLKNSFFGSGIKGIIEKTPEEKLKSRQDLESQAEEWRSTWEKDINDYQRKQFKRYKQAGFDKTDQSITSGVTSIGLMVPSLALSYATRNPSLVNSALPMFGGLTYAQTFEDSIARGLSIPDATKNSQIQAFSEIATEKFGNFFLVGGLKKFLSGENKNRIKDIMQNGVNSFIADSASEQVNTLIQSGSNAYFDIQDELRIAWDNRNDPFYEGPSVLDIITDNAKHTAIATAVAGGSITGVNSAIQLTPEIKRVIRSRGETEGKEIFDNLGTLITNKDLNKIALDKAAVRLNSEEFANNKSVDPSDIIAEELLKVSFVGRSEIAEQESLTLKEELEQKFDLAPEKKPAYSFGQIEQRAQPMRKEPGQNTTEITLDFDENISNKINTTQSRIETSIPNDTTPLNLQRIQDDNYDASEIKLVENYILNPREFNPDSLKGIPARFADNNLYRIRDFSESEKINAAKSVIDLRDADMPTDIFSDLGFMGIHVKDDRFKTFNPAYGVYIPEFAGITLAPISGIANLNFENIVGSKIQARDTIAHELGHHIDFGIGKDPSIVSKTIYMPATAQSPLFDIPNMRFENGVMDIDLDSGGIVMKEALQIFQATLNTPENYYGGHMLKYPLGELIANGDQLIGGQELMIRTEVFAQMHALYYTNRQLLDSLAPETYKLIEAINDAISVDGTTRKNQGVRVVLQSPGAKRSIAVSGREQPAETTESIVADQEASTRVEEPGRTEDRDDIRSEIPTITGAPRGVDTNRKVGALRRKVKKLVEAGENNKFWYEESSKAILDITQGNIEDADKLAQAIAITSPRTNVDVNFTFALQAYYQWKSGSPIETGIYPAQMGPKLEKAFAGEDWEGKKTNNFYNNLMRVIDPSKAQGVTVDMWMARMFGYTKPTGEEQLALGPAQYDFVAKEIQKITDELGWEPQQVQAAAWVAEKSKTEGTELGDAGFSYATAVAKNLVQISTETIPGKTNNHMSEMLDAPYEQVQEYHVNAAAAILDNDGADIIAKRLDLLSPGIFEAPGYFEEKLSPGSQTEVVVPQERKTKEIEIQKDAEDLIKAYSAVYGILFKQDAVGYHKPFYKKSIAKSKRNLHEIRIGRAVTNEEIVALANSMAEISGKDYLNPIPTPTGVRFINFAESDGINNIQFGKLVDRVIDDVKLADNVEVIEAAAALGYLENNWSESKNGENYTQVSLAGRPDLQERVRDIVRELQPRIDEVDQSFSEKYGWTRDESINPDYRQPGEISRKIDDDDVDLSLEPTQKPAPAGKPFSENYPWTGGDELNANLMLQKVLTKLQNMYERQVVVEEVIEDQYHQGILKDLDLSVVDKLDLMKSIVGNDLLNTSEEMEQMLKGMFDLADNSYKNINDFLYNLHAPERNKFIYKKFTDKLDAAIEKYGDDPSPAQKGQITRLTNLSKPFENNGSGIETDVAIETLREKYGVEYDNNTDEIKAINEKGEKYIQLSKLASEFLDGTRKIYKDNGLVDEENLDDWDGRYKYYIPLSGFAADTNVDGTPNSQGRGLSVYGLEVPKAKGRTSMAGDAIIQMYKQRENAIVRKEKNNVVKTLADQARTFVNPDVYEVINKIPPRAKYKPEWDPIEQTAYVFFKEDGKQKAVVIRDERLARAFQHLDVQGMNAVIQTIAIGTRFLSIMNTGYNPDFIIPNFARDIYAATAGAVAEQEMKGGRIYGENIAAKSVKKVFPRLGELYTYYRKGPEKIKDPEQRAMAIKYHELGSKTSYFEFLDTDKLTKNFTALEKYRAGKISAKDFKRFTLDLIGDINNMIENGIRFSQFTEYVKAKGGLDKVSDVDLTRAATQAKNSSINFDRRGEWGANIGALLMFFNPAVQGSVQFIRGQNIFTKRGRARLSPKKMLGTGLGAALMGSLYTIYNMLMSGEDEDGESMYSKIPDYEKARNLLLVMPDEITMSAGEGFDVKKFGEIKKYTKGDVPFAISIPQAYGYNVPFNLGRLFAETQAHILFPDKFDKPLTSIEKAGYELADSFVTSFSPIGGVSTEKTGIPGIMARSRAFAPSVIFRPALDIAANETFFGGPITKKDFPFGPKRPGFTKASARTNQFYVDLTETLNTWTGGNDYSSGWLDLDPNNLKYFIDWHLGGLGRTVERNLDLPRKIKNDTVTKEDIMILRSFTAEPRDFVNGQLFYQRKEEIDELLDEYKNLKGKDRIEFQKNNNMGIVKLGDWKSPTMKKRDRGRSKAYRDATKPKLTIALEKLSTLRKKRDTAMNLYKVNDPDKYDELIEKYRQEEQKIYLEFNKAYNKKFK